MAEKMSRAFRIKAEIITKCWRTFYNEGFYDLCKY
jgi:hypothetical protein